MKRVLNFTERINERFINKQGCGFKIIKYNSSKDCDIMFDDGFIVKNLSYNTIKKGSVKNPYYPSVFGVGYIGEGFYGSVRKNDEPPYHKLWCGMLERCYNLDCIVRLPTYKDVTVCEEWHNFQNFAKWVEKNYIEGFELDKDVICKSCKRYSPETCAFIPQEINKLISLSNINKNSLPLGVRFKNKRFQARVFKNGKSICLGTFKTVDEAFLTYKIAKEQHIREIADKWKDLIDSRVHQALYNYKVEING